MALNLKDKVYKALEGVNDPEINKSLIELNMIGNVIIEEGKVLINVLLTTAGCPLRAKINEDIKRAVSGIDGITGVEVVFGEMSKEQKEKLVEKLRGKKRREDVFKNTRIIAVGSGKGGVGKSTVTANLAVALNKAGLKVGLIDADILGYSIPHIMGIKYQKPVALKDGLLMPLEKHGVKVVSMGNLVDREEVFIWRGPMLGKMLEQFLYDVYWDEPDILLIDLPPGTGDVPLSLMQTIRNIEILIVTTPQITAASVAKRLGLMAKKTDSRVIGIIENMSYFICDKCGEKHFIFGQGEGKRLSEELGVPLLGQIPLVTAIREESDKGVISASDTGSVVGKAYMEIAAALAG